MFMKKRIGNPRQFHVRGEASLPPPANYLNTSGQQSPLTRNVTIIATNKFGNGKHHQEYPWHNLHAKPLAQSNQLN